MVAELARRAVGRVVLPLVLSLLWGRLRMAGAIAGVMLAVLLHVTVGLAVIAATYLALERLARRSSFLAWALAAVVVVGGARHLRRAPASASADADLRQPARGEGVARQVLRVEQVEPGVQATATSPRAAAVTTMPFTLRGNRLGTVRTRCHPPTRPEVTTADTTLAKAAPSTVPSRPIRPIRIADGGGGGGAGDELGRLRSRKGLRAVGLGLVGLGHLTRSGRGQGVPPVRRPRRADRFRRERPHPAGAARSGSAQRVGRQRDGDVVARRRPAIVKEWKTSWKPNQRGEGSGRLRP